MAVTFNPSRRTMLTLCCLLSLSSCKSAQNNPSDPTSPANQTYQVRGVLVAINPQRATLDIQHEDIPDFVSSSGEKVGMPAMTMPFHVSSKIATSELAVGNKIAFTMEVRWGSEQELFIPYLTRLPADTELRLK